MLERPKKTSRPANEPAAPAAVDSEPARAPVPRSLGTRFAAAVRWLHIYVSLLGFTALIFFAITGITLNHPTWFYADSQRVTEFRGEMPLDLLRPSQHPDTSTQVGDLPLASNRSSESVPDPALGVAKLEVAEHLRSAHQLRGAVQEFRVDEQECMVVFKGPGYAADAFINRESGKYTVTVTAMGAIAIMNDLHKGRDSGQSWSLVIDVSALLTVFVSVTGLILIFYLRRKRWSGILTAVAGTILLVVIYVLCVP